MGTQIFAYITHAQGVADDVAYELINAARKIDSQAKVIALVLGTADELENVAQEAAKIYPEVWKVDNSAFAYPNAEIIRKALQGLLPSAGICLIPHDTFGMDLGPGLSIKLDSAFVGDVVDIEGVEEDNLKLVRQEYSGQVSTHVHCDISTGAVLSVRPGGFPPEENTSAGGEIVDKSGEVSDIEAKRKFLEILEAEVGEVDITKEEILVSIGRGIEDEENIEIAEDLAKAMGGVVSCSRPVVDAKWMEKSRQVGTSGKTVKPKVYLAMGISGSFQHMGGVKGNPYIVAVNKNPKAPIFQVADLGIVDDLLEFAPVLTEKIEEMK